MKHTIRQMVEKAQQTAEESVGYSGTVVTMTGNFELLIEGNRGIVAYDENCILIRAERNQLKIEGADLTLSSMAGENLTVRGRILSVSWIS